MDTAVQARQATALPRTVDDEERDRSGAARTIVQYHLPVLAFVALDAISRSR